MINPINFTSAFKTILQKGNLVYEYNPLHNFRLTETKFEYLDHLYSLEEINTNFHIYLFKKTISNSTTTYSRIDNFQNSNLSDDLVWSKQEEMTKDSPCLLPGESPIIRREGEIVDFDTNSLKFSLNNPVDISPQYSYDGSVNLILNDGTNLPRLINSRFSPLGKNKYLIVDRKGDNDTNLYNLGSKFDIDSSLYKRTNSIPKLTYKGTFSNGLLPVGNYHFYFKYADADGNETDFVAESGLVSIFKGDSPLNINTGFRNLNSFKGVFFNLTNIDPSYSYILVYYSRTTADIDLNSTVSAIKITYKFPISSSNQCSIRISGFESTTEITTDELNTQYFVASSAYTLAQCLNRLFLGNVSKANIDYSELSDISLRICPLLDTSETYDVAKVVTEDYSTGTDYKNSYYNSNYIYNKLGYWPEEIYRFGVVYILSDNTLSPVFNIRGKYELSINNNWKDISVWDKDNNRQKVEYDLDDYTIINSSNTLENIKGVISIKNLDEDDRIVYGIKFNFLHEEDCIELLKSLGIRGYFFVRQKRIPLTLCEAYMIGVDKCSHTPVIPYEKDYIAESFLNQDSNKRYLSSIYSKHILKLSEYEVDSGAICPEYDVNTAYLNSLFTGGEFNIKPLYDGKLDRAYSEERHYVDLGFKNSNNIIEKVNIIGLEDDVKLVAIKDTYFSARAGEAEEAKLYEYCGKVNKITECTNLLRGSYGPYLGITNNVTKNGLISIKIPSFSYNNLEDYFQLRYEDKSAYYPISDRLNLYDYNLNKDNTYYRGDCYICQYTHRLNRNFQDPSAPANDKIVDEKTWHNNYKVTDNVVDTTKLEKVNLGDINAVGLGLWITFTLRSNYNLNIRSIDESNTAEKAVFGHNRSYYPNTPISYLGAYKLKEALCYNKGFGTSLGEISNFEEPDIPATKNDFSNRICYSDISVNDAFKNGFRVFGGTNYRDYPKTYGSITKLLEFRGTLIVVFEHGVALISVNERALAGEGPSGSIYINTSNVLPDNPKILSDTFGSLWPESVIKTDIAVYGVDSIGKKIWRTNGSSFECISDFKVLKFLNDNITLTERELEPIIGVRNIKTHYNKFKQDVMFTFYDNLHGFEEKVWNLCYNELLQEWVTFYSWVPSYSENINNQFFSFDRNTSKWIAKLGVSKKGSKFQDGVVLTNNIFDNSLKVGELIGELDLVNRNLNQYKDLTITVSYSLERDLFHNLDYFKIKQDETSKKWGLYLLKDATELCSELYIRGTKQNNEYTWEITNLKNDKQLEKWKKNCVLNDNYVICKNEYGKLLKLEKPLNSNKLLYLLNVRANIKISYTGNSSLIEAYSTGLANSIEVDAGYYKSTIAVIPKYNMLFLTTDFWKHGLAGIIDISEKVLPCQWYGRLHPFEFEFVVAEDAVHKIFDNLEIISNNAEPESFHYEIVGDCYDFANDKKNMYIRQEATKHLYQYNGCDITFNSDYLTLDSEHRKNYRIENGQKIDLGTYDKSTLLPLYYLRLDSINEVYESYKSITAENKDYSALAGGEIIHDTSTNEYHILNHAKAVDITDPEKGRLRGNMLYKEDKWYVLINSLNIVLKNEPTWVDLQGNQTNRIPVELKLNPIPSEVLSSNTLEVPDNFKRGYVLWNWEETQNKEVKMKDKWIKIRIRYKGDKLAVISAIATLYSISYS